MITFLFYAAIIAGFVFPAYLIQAIKRTDASAGKYTALSCFWFGIIVIALLVITAYS